MIEEKRAIKPTVGRMVHFYPGGAAQLVDPKQQPIAAIIAYVHSDTLVNIACFDQSGRNFERTSIYLLPSPESTLPTGVHSFCTWMPYQLGQAERTRVVERLLDIGSGG